MSLRIAIEKKNLSPSKGTFKISNILFKMRLFCANRLLWGRDSIWGRLLLRVGNEDWKQPLLNIEFYTFKELPVLQKTVSLTHTLLMRGSNLEQVLKGQLLKSKLLSQTTLKKKQTWDPGDSLPLWVDLEKAGSLQWPAILCFPGLRALYIFSL